MKISQFIGGLASSALFMAPASAAAPPVATSFVRPVGTTHGTVAAADDDRITGALQVFNVDKFGAKGDAVTDDTAAFVAAIAACNTAHGGVVQLGSRQYLINSGNLALAANCPLRGGQHPGTLRSAQTGYAALDYSTIPYSIRLNPAYSIFPNRSAGFEGVTVVNPNLVTPTTLQQGLADIAAMTGTAVAQGPNGATGAVIRNNLILGYNQCLSLSGLGNARVYDNGGDCLNGFSIDNSHDVSFVEHNEMFGWLTTNQSWSTFSSAVSGVTNNGSGLARVAFGTTLPLTAGTQTYVWINGVVGVPVSGRYLATVIDGTHVDLQGSTFSGSYTSGGTFYINLNYRHGTAFLWTNSDGGTLAHNFAFGYDVAYHLGTNANFPTLDDDTFDGDQLEMDNTSIGYLIDGTANSINIVASNFQSEAYYGMVVNTTSTNTLTNTLTAPRISCNGASGCKAIDVRSGSLIVQGGAIYNGLHVASGARFVADGVDAGTLSTPLVVFDQGSDVEVIGGRWPFPTRPAPGSSENRIINGDFSISQLFPGTNAGAPPGNGIISDRWKVHLSGLGSDISFGQQTSGPAGYNASELATVAAAATPTAAQFFVLDQRVEGRDVADLGWGSASATAPKSIVASLYLQASAVGSYSVSLYNGAQNRSFVHKCAVPVSGAWTYCAFVVPPDTAGTWLTAPATIGLDLAIDQGSGSNYQTGTLDAWQAGLFYEGTGSTQLVANAAATLAMSGVRIRAGVYDVPAIPRPFEAELAMAQRFQSTDFSFGTKPAPNAGVVGALSMIAPYGQSTFATVGQMVNFPVPMMAPPTLTFYNPKATSGSNCYDNTSGATTGAPSALNVGTTSALVTCGLVSGNALGDQIIVGYSAQSEL